MLHEQYTGFRLKLLLRQILQFLSLQRKGSLYTKVVFRRFYIVRIKNIFVNTIIHFIYLANKDVIVFVLTIVLLYRDDIQLYDVKECF